MPRAANPRVCFRVAPTSIAEAGDQSARWTRAEGKSVDHPDAQRRLFLIGMRVVKACPLCAASQLCPTHSAAALVDAEPPPLPPRYTPEQRTDAIERYFIFFERAMGVKPAFGAREGKAINQLLERIGFESAAFVIENAYRDPVWAKRKGTTILRIAADPSAFLGNSSPSTTLQQAPRNGKTWKRAPEHKI